MEQVYLNVKGQLLAKEAELEAMKAANTTRERNGEALAYSSDSFFELSKEIMDITNQLFK